MSNISAISRQEQVTIQWDDDDVHFVLHQHAELDFYSASSLKQQSMDRYVPPLYWFWVDPAFALKCLCLAEKQQIPIL